MACNTLDNISPDDMVESLEKLLKNQAIEVLKGRSTFY